MAFDDHTNGAVGTISSAPSPALSGTSITLNPGDGAVFPTYVNGFECYAYDPDDPSDGEVVRVGAHAALSDTFSSLTRNADGEGLKNIRVGWRFAAGVTKKVITDLEQILEGLAVYVNISNAASMRAAIQAAIDKVNTAYLATGDPGVVMLPAGDFTLEDTTPITRKSGVLVKGQGKGTTILRSPTTGSAYTMFRTPGTAAAVNYGAGRTALTANAPMGQRYVDIASTTGWAAGDYLTIAAAGTGSAAIAQLCRVRAVTSGTRLTLYESLHDTFNTAKSASILKMNNMLTRAGLEGMTLIGTTATGADSYGVNDYEFNNCRVDIATEGWTGTTGAFTGASLVIGYRSVIDIEDEGSGGSTTPAIQPQLLSECKINLYAHNPISIGVRADFCHGNIMSTLFSEGQQSRGIKLSCCNRNAIGAIYSSGARLDDPGEGRSFVFSDSSHHNAVGAIQSGDNVQLDVWFDGGISGVNDASVFSDSYNSVGAVASGGAASGVNVYVGATCVGNHIASLTPGSCTLDDLSLGLGLTIGNAMPIMVMAKDMDIKLGTPTYQLAGAGGYYGCWDVADLEAVIYNVKLPQNYACNGVRPVVHWTNRTAGAGTIVWRPNLGSVPDGSNINSVTLTATDHTATAAPTLDVIKRTPCTAIQQVAGGDLVIVYMVRNNTGSLHADVGLIGIELIPA